jgi:cysteine synthase A
MPPQTAILQTPTVRWEDTASGATLWLKLDFLQPSGSTKDRIASHILEKASANAHLSPRSHVVEASSGSTSIAFAMACARRGLRFTAVMPEGVSDERVWIIQRYGGKVILTPRDQGILGAMRQTLSMAEDDPAVFLPRQFENEHNAEAHEFDTGPELLAAMPQPPDAFVAGVGTGGTLMGTARALQRHNPHLRSVRAIPERGSTFAGQPEICCGIPGVVEGLSKLLRPEDLNHYEEVFVSDHEAIMSARALCAAGYPVGPSSGLNLAAARIIAARLGPGSHIATILCDRMERYFSSDLFSDLRSRPQSVQPKA